MPEVWKVGYDLWILQGILEAEAGPSLMQT